MRHSIIVSYRTRPTQLFTFLESLDLPDGWELVIADLGSTDARSAELIAQHKDRLRIRHLWVDYHGTFHKSKAQNYALKRCPDTEWITCVDIDAIFSRRFWHEVEEWMPTCDNPKIGYTVYRFPYPLVRHILFEPRPDWYDTFERKLILQPDRYPMPFEMHHEGKLCGTSHITMRREDILSVGGWDEKYVGYGPEDVSFNMTCRQKWGDPVIYPKPIFHQMHAMEADWQNHQTDKDTRRVFEERKAQGFPPTPINADWGEFPKDSDTLSANSTNTMTGDLQPDRAILRSENAHV